MRLRRNLFCVFFTVLFFVNGFASEKEGAEVAWSGGLTLVFQGSSGNPQNAGGDRADMTFSTDLFIETTVVQTRKSLGAFLLRLDTQQGAGIGTLPLFTAPNGATTGINGDVETWLNIQGTNVAEVKYEHHFFDSRRIQLGTFAIGLLDPTAYFDANQFANSETDQLLAPLFVNNISVDWGGNANFFSQGLVLNYKPNFRNYWTIGIFDGDADVARVLDHPFLMAEAGYRWYPGGMQGNYRLYAWERHTGHPLILDVSALKKKNSGFGLSFDQALMERFGLWGRFGIQDGSVAQFDKSLSAGFQLKNFLNRPDTVFGLGYGISFPGSEQKTATGLTKSEHYLEAYYSMRKNRNFFITPDIQWIQHPGGLTSENFFVYGLRSQVHF